jgi:hypothetical protein
MLRRQVLGLCGLSLASAFAGCSFTVDAGTPSPSSPTQAIAVQFSNETDRVLWFTAVVAPGGFGGLRIRYRDDSERTLDAAEELADVPADAWDGAVTFEALAEDSVVRRFRSTAGSGTGMSFEGMARGSSVVTSVADPTREDSMLSVTAGTCGDSAHATVRVVADGETISHGTTCTDD